MDISAGLLTDAWSVWIRDTVVEPSKDSTVMLVTLTFADIPIANGAHGTRPPGLQAARKRFNAWWLKVKGFVPAAFWCEERGALNSRLHYHGLCRLSKTGAELIVSEWEHGFTHLREVESVDGACGYVAKYVSKGLHAESYVPHWEMWTNPQEVMEV